MLIRTRFGYVEFDNLDSAAAAIQSLDQQVFEGRRMVVQYHVRRQPNDSIGNKARNPPSKTLFVGNLSFQMTDKDLSDLFRECKNVLDIRVAIDRRSGQPRGFAHADFISTEDAQKAKKMLETKQVYGRHLRLDYARASSPTFDNRPDAGDREDRPQRSNGGDREDRPRRSYGGDREDRPQRSYVGDREDRPRRSYGGDREDRPRRSYGGDREDRF